MLPIERRLMGMRELDITRRLTGRSKYLIECIAWATNRRGNVAWKRAEGDRTVSITIFDYLERHNVALRDFEPRNIAYVLARLAELGFATIATDKQGIAEFAFKPDVITSGHTPDFNPGGVPGQSNVADAPSEKAKLESTLIPLPVISTPRYLATEIDQLLDMYAKADPESYAIYADKLVAILKTALTN